MFTGDRNVEIRLGSGHSQGGGGVLNAPIVPILGDSVYGIKVE